MAKENEGYISKQKRFQKLLREARKIKGFDRPLTGENSPKEIKKDSEKFRKITRVKW